MFSEKLGMVKETFEPGNEREETPKKEWNFDEKFDISGRPAFKLISLL